MKILILTDYYPSQCRPDSRAFIHARAKLYVSNGEEVLVLSTCSSDELEREAFEGIEVIRSGSFQTALAAILEFDPDVIAVHTPYKGSFTTNIAAEIGDKYPLIAWIHGYEALYTAFFGYHRGVSALMSLPHDWLKLRHLRTFLSECTSVVYVSDWMRRVSERSMRFVHPQTTVVFNPIDTAMFSPDGSAKVNTYISGIALRSLGPKYGLDIAVEAYSQISDTDLTIVGTGPLEESLRQQIAQSRSQTKLQVEGYLHDAIPHLLRQYDYFVSPSRIEAQGLAMCEAMACGLPVIATNVGGIPEFVRDGIDGYLVPPEDPAALRAAVEDLISDPVRMKTMGRDARQHMVDVCDGAAIASQELSVFEQASREFWRNP